MADSSDVLSFETWQCILIPFGGQIIFFILIFPFDDNVAFEFVDQNSLGKIFGDFDPKVGSILMNKMKPLFIYLEKVHLFHVDVEDVDAILILMLASHFTLKHEFSVIILFFRRYKLDIKDLIKKLLVKKNRLLDLVDILLQSDNVKSIGSRADEISAVHIKLDVVTGINVFIVSKFHENFLIMKIGKKCF